MRLRNSNAIKLTLSEFDFWLMSTAYLDSLMLVISLETISVVILVHAERSAKSVGVFVLVSDSKVGVYYIYLCVSAFVELYTPFTS